MNTPAAAWRPLPRTSVVLGHRGNGSGPEENTTLSFTSAFTAGAAWVELDVLVTDEGLLPMTHAHFLAGRPVWQMSEADLSGMNVEFFDDRILDLPVGLGLNIEIKPSPGDADPRFGPSTLDALLSLLPPLAFKHPVLVSSFDPTVVRRAVERGVPAGWIAKQTLPLFEAVGTAVALGAQALIFHGPTTGEASATEISVSADLARRAGVLLWEWGAIPDLVESHTRWGVSGFCGDDVPRLVAATTATATVPLEVAL